MGNTERKTYAQERSQLACSAIGASNDTKMLQVESLSVYIFRKTKLISKKSADQAVLMLRQACAFVVRMKVSKGAKIRNRYN